MLVEILHPIAKMEAEERKEQEYAPRPSLAGPERCIRQLTYQRIGQVPDTQKSGRFVHILDMGFWHEGLSASWIHKSAFQLHSEQLKVTCWDQDGIKIDGSIDGIITDLMGIDRLYEHKAINHFTFEGYWNEKEYPEDYFTQMALYLRGLYALLPDIREALLVIKNKATEGFIEYLLRYDFDQDFLKIVKLTRHTGDVIDLTLGRVDICRAAVQKFKDVDAHAAAGTLPDRPYTQDHWRCRYCPFLDTCWKGYVEEVDALAPSVELDAEEADRVRYYQELGAHIKEQEDERKGIGKDLVATLKAKGAKKGTAGEYTVSLVVQDRQTINWDAVPLLVQRQLDTYRQQSISEFVKVSKPKLKG